MMVQKAKMYLNLSNLLRAPAVQWSEHQTAGDPKSFLDFDIVPGATGLTRSQARTWNKTS